MTEEKKEVIAPEAGEIAPQADNQPAAPAESPTGEKEAEIKEEIDPRIVGIIGKDKIQSAFGEQPKEDGNPAEDKKNEVKEEEPGKKGQEKKDEGKGAEEVELPNIPPLEPKPTRLDRRLANRYIRVLHLKGAEKIPTEEEIIADLKKYSREEKEAALHHHLREEKRLRGEALTGDDLDDEDKEAIQDAEREAIRHEILAEEHEKQVLGSFVEFIDNHPELDAEKKEFNPQLAKAVETLWRGGMTIQEAFETVAGEIQAVKEAQMAAEKNEKNKALSGVISGTGQVPPEGKELGWEDVERISKEDPQMYRRMLSEGKFKHLM
jgi:hypothetical protein